MIPVATDRFRLSARPRMGILTLTSQAAASSGGRPCCSLPIRISDGFTGGPTKWTGGKVYNANDGGTYSGTITMISANELKLKGCIVAPLCKTEKWSRIK